VVFEAILDNSRPIVTLKQGCLQECWNWYAHVANFRFGTMHLRVLACNCKLCTLAECATNSDTSFITQPCLMHGMQEWEILPWPVVSKAKVITGMFAGVKGSTYHRTNPNCRNNSDLLDACLPIALWTNGGLRFFHLKTLGILLISRTNRFYNTVWELKLT
jgi:hypothetical protein